VGRRQLVRRLQGTLQVRSAEMPEKKTLERAKQVLRQGKSPSTAAGEFVREEIERMRHGKNGPHSPKQAIAIGLAKARRAGVPLRPQPESGADERSRHSVERAYETGQEKKKHASASPGHARRQHEG
jgi:hypothetical protein